MTSWTRTSFSTPSTRTGAESEISTRLLASATDGAACISFQVVQEVLNILTRRDGGDLVDTRQFLHDLLMPLWTIMPSFDLYERAMGGRFGYRVHDALIIAAAIEAGCRRLLTEDLQHGQRIEGLSIENPFRLPGPGLS